MATQSIYAANGFYDDLYERRHHNKAMSFDPDYRVKEVKKELKEFSIKGHKIMAYSKKDAIKRLKHR
jgi:hypothetical protein